MTIRLIYKTLWFFTLLFLLTPFAARGQDAAAPPAGTEQPGITDAELGESVQAVRELQKIKDKTIIFIFDISGSMRGQDMSRAREATINLIREATTPGDRLVLMTFGAGYQTVFDETVQSEGDKDTLIDRVPSDVGAGAGTNIRKPHHDALKILDNTLPRPGAVVLLTDSLNDEPKKDDPAWATYLRYYTPGGRLQKYPDTPENRDYERLLAKMKRSQKVNMYGIGVQIDQSGRPIERLPQAAPEPIEAPPTFTPAVTQPVEQGPQIPWLWIGLGLGALLLALLLLMPLTKSFPLRISGGPAGPKDFRLKSGGAVQLGGDGANFAFDAYPLPGVSAAPATIKAARGQMALVPGGNAYSGATVACGESSGTWEYAPQANAAALPKVFHNGLPLEKEAPLAYGDEVRVSVPDPSSGVARDFRLKFEDPTKSF